MKKIIILKKENVGKSILPILKTLYEEGSEIKSIQDIEKQITNYQEKGSLELNFDNEVIPSLNFIKENFQLNFRIV